MKRTLLIAAAAAATMFAVTAAEARVNWSVGINLPPVGTVVSSPGYYGPSYVPAYTPSYGYPAPVYYEAPVYSYPSYGYPAYRYAPPAVYVRPRIGYAPDRHVWYPGPSRGGWDRGGRGDDHRGGPGRDGDHRGHDGGRPDRR